MSKVVALVEAMSVDQDKEFIKFLSEKGWGYWHWIDGAWLLNVHDGVSDVSSAIRDKIKEIAPGKHCIIFEITGVSEWSGFGPNAEDNNMFKWIRNEWE